MIVLLAITVEFVNVILKVDEPSENDEMSSERVFKFRKIFPHVIPQSCDGKVVGNRNKVISIVFFEMSTKKNEKNPSS